MNPLARNLGLLTSAGECAVLRRLSTIEARYAFVTSNLSEWLLMTDVDHRDRDTDAETCAPRIMLRPILVSVQHVHLLCATGISRTRHISVRYVLEQDHNLSLLTAVALESMPAIQA